MCGVRKCIIDGICTQLYLYLIGIYVVYCRPRYEREVKWGFESKNFSRKGSKVNKNGQHSFVNGLHMYLPSLRRW